MLNVFEVSEKLVNHIRSACPDDIAIIAYYGSYAQGTATKRSDLDFFFIPAASNGYRASLQFIVDGISFDFWPISWERAERMGSYQEPQTTIIADCKLLYVRSDEDRDRFMKLRETISALQKPEHSRRMAERAESELQNVYVHLYKLSRAGHTEDVTFYRIEAQRVLTHVLQSLALLNQTYYTKGFGKNMEQIRQLPLKPARLETFMHLIMHSTVPADILQACEQLTADTLELILTQEEMHPGTASYADRMKGFYEEEKGVLDKIVTACEMNDYDTAFFYSIHAQEEIGRFLYFAEKGHWPGSLTPASAYQEIYKQAGLPELVPLLDAHDLSKLHAAVESLGARLEAHLRSKGVHINRFENIGQFEAFLDDGFLKD